MHFSIKEFPYFDNSYIFFICIWQKNCTNLDMELLLNLDVYQLIDAIKQLPIHFKVIILEELKSELNLNSTQSFQQIFLQDSETTPTENSDFREISDLLKQIQKS